MAAVADAFAAGWNDGADDEALTTEEIERLVQLLAPTLRELDEVG